MLLNYSGFAAAAIMLDALGIPLALVQCNGDLKLWNDGQWYAPPKNTNDDLPMFSYAQLVEMAEGRGHLIEVQES